MVMMWWIRRLWSDIALSCIESRGHSFSLIVHTTFCYLLLSKQILWVTYCPHVSCVVLLLVVVLRTVTVNGVFSTRKDVCRWQRYFELMWVRSVQLLQSLELWVVIKTNSVSVIVWNTSLVLNLILKVYRTVHCVTWVMMSLCGRRSQTPRSERGPLYLLELLFRHSETLRHLFTGHSLDAVMELLWQLDVAIKLLSTTLAVIIHTFDLWFIKYRSHYWISFLLSLITISLYTLFFFYTLEIAHWGVSCSPSLLYDQ